MWCVCGRLGMSSYTGNVWQYRELSPGFPNQYLNNLLLLHSTVSDSSAKTFHLSGVKLIQHSWRHWSFSGTRRSQLLKVDKSKSKSFLFGYAGLNLTAQNLAVVWRGLKRRLIMLWETLLILVAGWNCNAQKNDCMTYSWEAALPVSLLICKALPYSA